MAQTLRIGSYVCHGDLVMAPMAGTTNAPFRAECLAFGAALTVSELVSAAGIVHDDAEFAKQARYLARVSTEAPEALQLFGSDPALMGAAVERLMQHPLYGTYPVIDINMGCPVPKVMRTGAGAALMGDVPRARALVQQVVARAQGRPVTVKIRSGLDNVHRNAVTFAQELEAAGAAAVFVHARTAEMRYAGRADWTIIREVKRALQIPVIGNGDVTSQADAMRMRNETGVDGVMVGRWVLGRPWRMALLRGQTVTAAAQRDSVLRLLDGFVALLGERIALAELRRLWAAALKGRRDASLWRARLFAATSAAEAALVLARCWDETMKDEVASV